MSLNVIKVLSVITFGPKCNKGPVFDDFLALMAIASDKTVSTKHCFSSDKKTLSLRRKAKKTQNLSTPLHTPSCARNARLKLINVQSSRGARLRARAANM